MTRLAHRPYAADAQRPGAALPLPRQTGPTSKARSGRPVLYGCFSCPWCYLARQHADQLPDLLDRPRWRMVNACPHLPVTGLLLDTAGRSRLQHELAAVSTVLLPGEQLPA